MRVSTLSLCAATAIVSVALGVPMPVLGEGAQTDDVALDLSLPADYPLIVNRSADRGAPGEPLPPSMPSVFDLPMLGSALDLPPAAQVGEVPDAEK